MIPKEYNRPFTVKMPIEYTVEKRVGTESQSRDGKLETGRVVWLDHIVGSNDQKPCFAYLDGVGVIRVDPHLLSVSIH